MHVIVGIAGLLGVLYATVALGQSDTTFTGLVYRPAMLLLVGGPVFIALTSHKLEELGACARLVWRAIRFSPARSRAVLHEELSRFAAEVRRGRPAEALAQCENASHDLLRQLGPLVVKQYAPLELERTAGTAAYVLSSSMKRSEDVLTSLARVAPATGLVGTTLGLISLLKDLRNFEQLGPSMALALLCTLYGLLLANAVYQPLGRLVHVHAVTRMEEARLLTRALLLVGEGKPLADVRALFGFSSEAAPAPRIDLAMG
jgi:chemotaxis protein MotA